MTSNADSVFYLDRFDGSGLQPRYRSAPERDVGECLTIRCWCKITADHGYHVIISRGEWTEGYSLMVLDTHDRHGGFRGFFGDAIVSANPAPRGTWCHVAMICDQKTLRLYVNGVLESEVRRHIPPLPGADIWVGQEALGSGNLYRGERHRHFLRGHVSMLSVEARAFSGDVLSDLIEAERALFGDVVLTLEGRLRGAGLVLSARSVAGTERFRMELPVDTGLLSAVRAEARQHVPWTATLHLVLEDGTTLGPELDDVRLATLIPCDDA